MQYLGRGKSVKMWRTTEFEKGGPAPRQKTKQNTLFGLPVHTHLPYLWWVSARPGQSPANRSPLAAVWSERERNKASNITFTTVPNSNTSCCVRLRPLCGLPLRWGWCQLYWGYQEPWQSYLRSPRTPHSVELLWRSLPAEHTQWCCPSLHWPWFILWTSTFILTLTLPWCFSRVLPQITAKLK